MTRTAPLRPGDAFPVQPDERADIIARLERGDSYDSICDWIGCSIGQVRRIAQAEGIAYSVYQQPVNAAVVADYRSGIGRADIAKRHKLNRDQIAGILRRAGVRGWARGPQDARN